MYKVLVFAEQKKAEMLKNTNGMGLDQFNEYKKNMEEQVNNMLLECHPDAVGDDIKDFNLTDDPDLDRGMVLKIRTTIGAMHRIGGANQSTSNLAASEITRVTSAVQNLQN